MTSRAGATISWASFNLPTVINGGGLQSTFSYGPDRERKQQTATYSDGTETTIYVGGLMEKVTTVKATTTTMYKHLIATPSGTEVIVTRIVNGGTSLAYVSTDHLGSSDTITDAAGGAANAVRLSFTAFGQRRGADWTLTPPPDWTGISTTTRHGFTQHEHLDNLALIHMNGRVYDPVIGRFLSADPVPGLTCKSQSWNPYSYVMNRPLRLIDPSGFLACPSDVCVDGHVSRFGADLGHVGGGGVGGSARGEVGDLGDIGDLGNIVVSDTQYSSPRFAIVLWNPGMPSASMSAEDLAPINDAAKRFDECLKSCMEKRQPHVRAAAAFVAATVATRSGKGWSLAFGAAAAGLSYLSSALEDRGTAARVADTTYGSMVEGHLMLVQGLSPISAI